MYRTYSLIPSVYLHCLITYLVMKYQQTRYYTVCIHIILCPSISYFIGNFLGSFSCLRDPTSSFSLGSRSNGSKA